jgi:hypothetical protein
MTFELCSKQFVNAKCDTSMKRDFIKILCIALEVLLRLLFCEPSAVIGKHVASLDKKLYLPYTINVDDGIHSSCNKELDKIFNDIVGDVNWDVNPSNTAIICMNPGSHYPSLTQHKVGTTNVSFSYIVWVGLKIASLSNIS